MVTTWRETVQGVLPVFLIPLVLYLPFQFFLGAAEAMNNGSKSSKSNKKKKKKKEKKKKPRNPSVSQGSQVSNAFLGTLRNEVYCQSSGFRGLTETRRTSHNHQRLSRKLRLQPVEIPRNK
jgi:hypothetical protein